MIRQAFRARGHDAVSCDLLPPDDGDWDHHMQEDAVWAATLSWDLMIAHPPCTYLASSGARWFKDPKRQKQQQKALSFIEQLVNMNHIPRIAIENPIGVLSTQWRKPDQIIQPWQYGHGEIKATCLWLKGLQPLVPTNIVEGRAPRVHSASPGPDRWKERSRTLPGIAAAMAERWGTP